MKATAPRTRYHHGSLESALVDEAVRQVRERGADQVSLRGLAATVGVSPSAAYQHFPDKAALLVAVCGASGEELARRMTAAVEAVDDADPDAAAVGRFLAVGRAYLAFALEEPHLFRHLFGPVGAQPGPRPTPHDEVHTDVGDAVEDPAYAILLARLAELAGRGLLRPAAAEPALDVLAWSLVHGFSSLVVEGHLPADAAAPLLELFGRLVLTDEGYARFAALTGARS